MTIWQALAAKLDREPTAAEVKAEIARIREDALVETAIKGKLAHQRRAK